MPEPPRHAPQHVELPRVRLQGVLRIVGQWWLALLAAITFGALAAQLQLGSGIWFDGPVLGWLHDRRSPALTELMTRVTHLGDGVVLAGVATFATAILLWLRHPYSALFVGAAAAGAGAMNHAMKEWFARPRPDVLLQLSPTDGFAFPSGHSTGACAVYGALAIVAITRFPKMRLPIVALCVAVITLVGVSRAYLHVHFPSDVVAGWGVGLLWVLLLKPLVLGRGFRKKTIPEEELQADGVTIDAGG